MIFLRAHPVIRSDLIEIATKDPKFTQYEINIDRLPWLSFEVGFEGLTRTLQSQQISVKASSIFWQRLKDMSDGEVTPEFFLTLNEADLRRAGFTRQKASYMHGLCHKTIRNEFNPDALQYLSDQDAVAKITSLKGFGEWSAHSYLIFSLMRPDILPAKDLVLDREIMHFFDLDVIATPAQAQILAKPYNGKRTAFTLLLWYLQAECNIWDCDK